MLKLVHPVPRQTPEEVEAKLQAEWREKISRCVLRGKVPIPTIDNHYELSIDGWDVHELYTVLVEPMGPEGCCAGCTRLPQGWCAACDLQRENEAKQNGN